MWKKSQARTHKQKTFSVLMEDKTELPREIETNQCSVAKHLHADAMGVEALCSPIEEMSTGKFLPIF